MIALSWLIGLLILIGLAALLRLLFTICYTPSAGGHSSDRGSYWRCWSHEVLRGSEGEEEGDDARVRHFPRAEPLKAALLARQESFGGPKQPLLPQHQHQQQPPVETQRPTASRFAGPLMGLLKPVLPHFVRPPDTGPGGGGGGGHSGHSLQVPPPSRTPLSTASSPDPESPYSPTHTHPYAASTFQNPSWGTEGAAAIMRPAQDLQTPQQNFRSISRDIQRDRAMAAQEQQQQHIILQHQMAR
jgi:hypothetical protein